MVFFYIELTLIKGMIQYNYMPKPLTIEQFRDQIHEGNASDPLIFLESVMNGYDPRKFSGIYKLIMEMEDFTGGEITPADWGELVDYAVTHAKYHSVTLNESTSAARTIAEYLHAKRKQIEKVDPNSSSDGSSTPLTEEEIILFKEKFNDEF